MKKITKNVLKAAANISAKIAVKSCGATSFVDSYQPKVPEAVKKLAQKNVK